MCVFFHVSLAVLFCWQEERLLARLAETRSEHDRIGEACRARFNRVEVVTQWVFSGMSHRLFLEWARRWKEDLALAEKQRKENGHAAALHGPSGGHSGPSSSGGAASWRGAAPNLGEALGLIAGSQSFRPGPNATPGPEAPSVSPQHGNTLLLLLLLLLLRIATAILFDMAPQ